MSIEIFGQERVSWDINDYLSCYSNGEYYEPPINQGELINLYGVGAYHPSAIQAKVNILASTFIENQYLSLEEFEKFTLSYLITGNGYLEIVRSYLGNVLSLANLPAKFMRRAANLKDFVLIMPYHIDNKTYGGDRVFHFKEYDMNQEIYGRPYYLGAFHSINLNKSATVFRNRYYDNGSHAGFILYMTDKAVNEKDYKDLKEQLKNAKGEGNFKNVLLRAPNASKDGIQLIPISEVAAKDEFLNIKNATCEDILAAHRVSPQLMSILPNNTGGFGDAIKAALIFSANEISPIQKRMVALNKKLGVPAFDFTEYRIDEGKDG